MELMEHDILRLISRLAVWLDTFFSGALEARARLRLANWRLERVLREHGEDSEIVSRGLDRVANAQFAAEYWMDGSARLRKEIDVALNSGVSHWDLRLLSLNRLLVVEEGKLAVVPGWSSAKLTPVAIFVCVGVFIALIALTASSGAETRPKIAILCVLAASLTYLVVKWHQRCSLISHARRRVLDYLEHRGPVSNVSRLPRKWPRAAIEPTWNPPSAGAPTRSGYRNL